MSTVKDEIKVQIAKANRSLYEKGLSPGSDSGDISILDEESGYIYISPRPTSRFKIPTWSIAEPEHTVVIDIDGNVIDGGPFNLLATVEAPMHLHIYRARPDVKAIVHSHAMWSQMYAVTGQNVPSALGEQTLTLGGDIVCAKYGPAGSEELGEYIVEALGRYKMAAIMRNHGAVCLGRDIAEAFAVADHLEKGCQVTILARLLGPILTVEINDILDPSIVPAIKDAFGIPWL